MLGLVTEEKWSKAKNYIEDFSVLNQCTMVNCKKLQVIRNFLNYITTTYPIILSYLMGLHLTIDGWRQGRDTEGWKKAKWSEGDMVDKNSRVLMDVVDNGPDEVEVKSRMQSDVMALTTLISGDIPPLRRVRSNELCQVLYGFGDTSGSPFGATLGKGTDIFYEYGQWCTEESEQSSNWRELKNLVDSLEGWI